MRSKCLLETSIESIAQGHHDFEFASRYDIVRG